MEVHTQVSLLDFDSERKQVAQTIFSHRAPRARAAFTTRPDRSSAQVGQNIVHYFIEDGEALYAIGALSKLHKDGWWAEYDDGEFPHTLEEADYGTVWSFCSDPDAKPSDSQNHKPVDGIGAQPASPIIMQVQCCSHCAPAETLCATMVVTNALR